MGLLERFFGKADIGHGGNYRPVMGVNSYDVKFREWNGGLYDSDIARAAIATNASNMAKLKPKHIRRKGSMIEEYPDATIKKLLDQPNPYMNMYDFIYKVATQREINNTAFIYVERDQVTQRVTGLYPVLSNDVALKERGGEQYVQFNFKMGQVVTIPFENLIILRKHFYDDDLFGESNRIPLSPVLEIINTTNQGVVNAVKRSANLRGLLKFKQVLRDEDIADQVKKFTANYMSMNNSGGVAATDPRYEYESLNQASFVPNKAQMDHSKERIYSYFGVNDNIVQSKYSENEWNAYYENVIEPVAIQLSLEFTKKLFTDRAAGHGNEIIFETNRLQYAAAATKIQLVNTLQPMGALSINEVREIFNMAPVEGGDKRVQTLNVANVDIVDQYQGGTKAEPAPTDPGDEGGGNDE